MVASPPQIVLDETESASRLPRDMRMALIACALAIAVCTFNTTFLQSRFPLSSLTTFFIPAHDAFWLIVVAVLLLGITILRLPTAASHAASVIVCYSRTVIATLMALVLIGGVIGTHVVFHGVLTQDEFLAEFDATILRSGMAIAPVDSEWRPYFSALATSFMLPIPHGAGFASAYLPVNASLRAFGVARRLWPTRARWPSPMSSVTQPFVYSGSAVGKSCSSGRACRPKIRAMLDRSTSWFAWCPFWQASVGRALG
jgi:hypothetical protein